ncbi:MAG: GIY-YIG nuclease family protein [Gammaproteobacteria bacterium]|nr:GIY-YIG nuclease family protein [Gammaproteobacteria bacterium]
MERQGYVYILASRPNGTLYIGVTSNLPKRVWEHQHGVVEGFTRRYGAHLLVWYEVHPSMRSANEREKQLKHWNRLWKLRLIEEANPAWRDLSAELA